MVRYIILIEGETPKTTTDETKAKNYIHQVYSETIKRAGEEYRAVWELAEKEMLERGYTFQGCTSCPDLFLEVEEL